MNTLFDTLSSLDITFFSNLVLIGDFNIDVLSHSHYYVISCIVSSTVSPFVKSILLQHTVHRMVTKH